MSFTVADIEDLTRVLEEHPESCARIRRLLLSGEPPESEDPVAQRRETDRRLDRFSAALERSGQEFDRRMADSAARMDRTDQRFAESSARMDRYAEERAEAERRFDQQFAESSAHMDRYAEERAEAERRFDQQFAESSARMDRYAEERAEAERRFDQQLAESSARMDRYAEERAEAERRFDQQFAESSARMDRYAEERAEAEQRTDQRFAELAEDRAEAERRFDQRWAEIGERIDQLTETTKSHANDIGTLKGWNLEDRFRERPSAYLRSFFRRARAYTDRELDKLLDSGLERGVITEDDWEEVRLADVVVHGRRRDDGTEVFLVVEVSWGVGLYDLERAVRRAGILGRLVAPVLPVVAGNGVTAEARSRCDAEGVWLVLDGRVVPPNGTANSG